MKKKDPFKSTENVTLYLSALDAVKYGNVSLLSWIEEYCELCPDRRYTRQIIESMCELAARTGNILVLDNYKKYLFEIESSPASISIPTIDFYDRFYRKQLIDPLTSAFQFNQRKFYFEDEYCGPFYPETTLSYENVVLVRFKIDASKIYHNALTTGNVDSLNWLSSNREHFKYLISYIRTVDIGEAISNTVLCYENISSMFLVLNWFKSLFEDLLDFAFFDLSSISANLNTDRFIDVCVKTKSLDLFNVFVGSNTSFGGSTQLTYRHFLNRALDGKAYGIVKWLLQNEKVNTEYYKCRADFVNTACKYSDLDFIIYLRSEGYMFTFEACAHASGHAGKLDILKFLHETKCPWTIFTTDEAARMGHLTLLKWAIENECPYRKWEGKVTKELSEFRLDVLKHIKNQPKEKYTQEVIDFFQFNFFQVDFTVESTLGGKISFRKFV